MSFILRVLGISFKYLIPIGMLAQEFHEAGVSTEKQLGMTAIMVGVMVTLFILKDIKKYVEKSPKMWHTLTYTTVNRGIWLGAAYGLISSVEKNIASVGQVFLFLLATQVVGGILSTAGTWLKESKAAK